MIELGQWLPDQPALGSAGVTVAKNVLPAARGYKPFPDLSALSQAASERLTNLAATKTAAGTVTIYAGGLSKLFKFVKATGALADVSKSGGYATASTDRFYFTTFGDRLIACNNVDPLQFVSITSGGNFSDLVASLSSKFITTVRDFVVTANVTESGTATPYRLRWSALNDATSWTVGTNQADYQDIADAGAITGLAGGEFGVVFLERAIVRMQYVGSPLVFQFDRVETARGCEYPGSVVQLGSACFYIASDGFYVFDGNASRPIGSERVNRWFFDNSNAAYRDRITAAVDPLNQLVMWSFPSAQSGGGPDRLIVYNFAIDKWAYAEVTNDFVAPLFNASYTLDDLDSISGSLDALGVSLDSSSLKLGKFVFGGGVANKIGTFTGSNLAATIETAEANLVEGGHALVTQVTPHTTGGTVTVQVGERARQQDSVSYGSASSLNDAGFCPVRSANKYHRARLNLSGEWSYAQGIDLAASRMGKR
jgi:hypothetical protein